MIAPPSRGHCILVVDDDESVRLRIRDLLESPGTCEVIEADNGPDGLDLARTRNPDLILLDLMMPGMSGIEVCTRLRNSGQTREIPIIVLSAGDEQQSMPAALRAGAEDYLPKPIPSDELRAKVRTIMHLDRFRSLTRERKRLRWLVEHSQEALVMIDRDGRLVESNLEARRIFGLPDTPVADALAIIAKHYNPDPPDAFTALRSRGFLPGEGFAVCRPENTLAAARWLAVELFADEHDPSGDLLLKFSDRSARVQRDLEIWTFQHMISHKIRTPLNGMSSLLEIMAGSPSIRADKDNAELLDIVFASARRLEDTLISILRYHDAIHSHNRFPDHDGRPTQSWDQIMRTALDDAGFPSEHFHVRGETPPPLPHALAEAVHLGLVEVVGNYLKFTDASSAGLQAEFLSVAGSPSCLRLTAPGPAFPPDTIALLGNPYRQMENRFSGEIPGMGLGLATARICLRSLGADLRFSASTSPVGLTTEFVLPASDPLPALYSP